MSAAGKALGEQSFHAHGVSERIAKNGEAVSRMSGGDCYTTAPHAGLTKREHFAGLLTGDGNLAAWQTLSLLSKEALVGRARPQERSSDSWDAKTENQLAEFRWELDLAAAIRCAAADALLAELAKATP